MDVHGFLEVRVRVGVVAICSVAPLGSTGGFAGEVWAHTYVRSFDDVSVTVPESVTVSPACASWLASARTASPARPGSPSITVTVTRSEAELAPAVAVRVNANVVVLFTCRATKVMVCLVASPRNICGFAGEVWAHTYVRAFGPAPVALPESVTVSPSLTS